MKRKPCLSPSFALFFLTTCKTSWTLHHCHAAFLLNTGLQLRPRYILPLNLLLFRRVGRPGKSRLPSDPPEQPAWSCLWSRRPCFDWQPLAGSEALCAWAPAPRNAVLLATHLADSFPSFPSQLQCHLLQETFPGTREALEYLWNAWDALLPFRCPENPARSYCRVCSPGNPPLPTSSWVLLSASCLTGMYLPVLHSCGRVSKQRLSEPGPLNLVAPPFSTWGFQRFYACLYPTGRKGKSLENQKWKLFREPAWEPAHLLCSQSSSTHRDTQLQGGQEPSWAKNKRV